MPTPTTTICRTSEMVFEEYRNLTTKDNLRLAQPATHASRILNRKMNELGGKEGMRVRQVDFIRPSQIMLASEVQGHDRPRMLDIDRNVLYEIREGVSAYRVASQEADISLWLAADAQSWPAEKCDKMLKSVQNDRKFHTSEIIALLRNAANEFDNITRYRDLFASANALRLNINTIARDFSRHLESVARQVELAELKRK